MDRDDLAARIDTYMHRFGDINSAILLFIEDARQMIGQDLRALANWDSSNITVASGTGTVPTNLVEVQSIFGPDGQMLEYATPTFLAGYRNETGVAQYYTIESTAISGGTFKAYPAQDGTYPINYFELPDELTNGTDENRVLTALPFLYIAACMIPAMAWAQDGESLQTWSQLYDEQVRRANRRFNRSRQGREAVAQGTQSFVARPVSGA